MKHFFNSFWQSGDNREMPPGKRPSDDGVPMNDLDVVIYNPNGDNLTMKPPAGRWCARKTIRILIAIFFYVPV
jgi:hypothetical protein